MNFDNLIFAHRGVHNNIDIPENSIKAFKEALKNNLNIELDIQLTKDNKLVVFHDENLKRMSNVNKTLNELTYFEIKKLKLLETNETIPTFKEVLNIINKEIILDIEIKDTKKMDIICNKLVNELKNYKYPFIIKSFNPKIVKWFKKNKPEYIRGLLIKDNLYNKFIAKIIILYCNPNFLAISKKFINKNGIKSYLKKYPLLIWTISNKKEINKYKRITNNYICNNIPFK